MKEAGLSFSQTNDLVNIFRKYPEIKKTLVYGSRAKGNFNERSDLDLVIINSQISYQRLGDLIEDLNESDLPYTVDLQIFEDIKNKNLKDHILRVGKTLYPI